MGGGENEPGEHGGQSVGGHHVVGIHRRGDEEGLDDEPAAMMGGEVALQDVEGGDAEQAHERVGAGFAGVPGLQEGESHEPGGGGDRGGIFQRAFGDGKGQEEG